jgi:hypothetical protein
MCFSKGGDVEFKFFYSLYTDVRYTDSYNRLHLITCSWGYPAEKKNDYPTNREILLIYSTVTGNRTDAFISTSVSSELTIKILFNDPMV